MTPTLRAFRPAMLGLALLLPWAGRAAETPTAQALTPSAAYHLITVTALPNDGGFDFLTADGAAKRLYVTHADSIQVLDTATHQLLGTLPKVARPHGVVVLKELGRGFATSGEPGSVVVFDLKSLAKMGEVRTAKDADVLIHEPVTGQVISFNGDSGSVTFIDPVKLKALATLDLGGSPEVAVADGKGAIYDNLSDKGQLIKIDAKSRKVVAAWSISPGASATGLAYDAVHARLFIGCRNQLLVVMDAANGKVVQALPIGEHVDSTAFDAKSGNVFNSCGDGTLSVIHQDTPDRYSVAANLSTAAGARTLALDEVSGHVFTVTADTEPLPKDDTTPGKWRRKTVPGTFRVMEFGR